METPFKFLEAYEKNDRQLFFGRDQEIEDLYSLVTKSNMVVVYGKSGVGKTSLVKCGLATEFDDNEIVMIEVRRRNDLNESLNAELQKALKSTGKNNKPVPELIKEIFNYKLRPIYLFFDQFEELFISGKSDERDIFLNTLQKIKELDIPYVIILAIRQEYLGNLSIFRKEAPFLFDHILPIDPMDQAKSIGVVNSIYDKLMEEKYILRNGIEKPVTIHYDKTITPRIINIVTNNGFFVELPYLQVYLDKLFRIACEEPADEIVFNEALLDDPRISQIGTVINNLLDEQIKKAVEHTGEDSDIKILAFLKQFITDQDTKKQVSLARLYDFAGNYGLTRNQVEKCIEIFTTALLIRPLEGNLFELSHDSVAAKISQKRSDKKRTHPLIEGNPYKGLAAFTDSEEDRKRFFGRKEPVEKVMSLIRSQKLIVISGASGTGKSSLIKAGIFPELTDMGYQKFEIRPGDYPTIPLQKAIAAMNSDESGKSDFLLLIDQYEELITRSKNEKDIDTFESTILTLITNPESILRSLPEVSAGIVNEIKPPSITVLITVRADFEPQFKSGILAAYWDKGRYVLPYMSSRELEEAIERPAELAACYFEPVTLVKNIAEEVSGRPSALPLLSFALSQMYEASLASTRTITKEIFDKIGVFGALQTKANQIYDGVDTAGKKMMQEVLLRMVSFEGSEIASRRVYLDELDYPSTQQSEKAHEIIDILEKERLVIKKPDEEKKEYVEPAHDALLKGWTKLWVWIKDFGKDNQVLRSRLIQAVDDYSKTNNEKLLWNNSPWLDNLMAEANNKDGWLNKKELDFIVQSERVRQDSRELAKKAEEEKTKLTNEKLKAQSDIIKKNRKFRTVITAALCIAAALGTLAFFQRQKALNSLSKITQQKKEIDVLNSNLQSQFSLLVLSRDSLIQKQDSLDEAQQALSVKNDSISKLVSIARVSEKKAIASAAIANQQRIEAEKAAFALQKEVSERVAAQELARIKGDSLVIKMRELSYQKETLEKTNDSLSLTIAQLKEQKEITLSQVLNFSKTFEQTDPVKAFRVAELAYKMDSLKQNDDVRIQYNKLANKYGYYYSQQFTGKSSSVSPDGQYMLTTGVANGYLKLIKNSPPYEITDSIKLKEDFMYADFSPKTGWVTVTSKNRIDIYTIANDHRLKNPEKISDKDIILSKYDAAGSRLLVLTKDELKGYSFLYNADPVEIKNLEKKNKGQIATAVFSEDGTKTLYSFVNGVVNIMNNETGKPVVYKSPKTAINSYISPHGNYFIVNAGEGLFLYNSLGEQKSISWMQKEYGHLIALAFTADKKTALFTFLSSFSGWSNTKNALQPQQSKGPVESKVIIHFDLASLKEINNVTDFLSQEDISLLNSSNTAILVKDNNLLFGSDQGLVKSVDMRSGKTMYLRGHQGAVNSISFNKGYILTSADDNTTRIWETGTPLELDRLKRIPGLTREEMERYGVK
jgi:energy-coupling factor transporter ATP-binding protein EcfA2